VTIVLPEREITLDDVASMAAADGAHRYEFANGALTIMSPADSDHASIVMRLAVWLVQHGHDPDLVKADVGLRAGGKVGRTPDLMVLRAAPTPDGLDRFGIRGARHRVIGDGSGDIDRKVKPAEYAGAGIKNWRVGEPPGPDGWSVCHIDVTVGGYRAQRTCSLRELLAARPRPRPGRLNSTAAESTTRSQGISSPDSTNSARGHWRVFASV
jgi:hypothetical protein